MSVAGLACGHQKGAEDPVDNVLGQEDAQGALLATGRRQQGPALVLLQGLAGTDL